VIVCVLGTVEVRDGDVEIPIGGRQARRLVARLALDAPRSVPLGSLELAAWPNAPPRTARHTIATHMLRLRNAGLAIKTTTDGYCLATPTDAAELERVLAAAGEAVPVDAEHASSLLGAALSLWRSRPYPELDHVEEAVIAARRLEDLVEGAREALLATQLDSGPAQDLIAAARQLANEQPYRERRWELLMLALYRSGRQAEALEVFAQARRRLVDDLGLDPGPALRRMQHAVLAQDPELDVASLQLVKNKDRSTVPGAATRLIGRRRERLQLDHAWARGRLVTLIGPPGAGKSRLAIEVSRLVEPAVWYISVEQIPAEQSVAAAVLDVVTPSSRAMDARQGVVDALSARDGLLVLDACEGRLGEVAGDVEALLSSCPGVRVLTTSRERLGLLDEALVPVGPLPEDDAIALLVDRACLVDPTFTLAPGDEPGADRLCALVDRLPLGLELVARHLRLLDLGEVAERVEADLGRWAGEPAGGRPGLWAAVDTSVARLGSADRQVLVALAVMVADADTRLVADVAGTGGGETGAFEALGRLVDASLVQVRRGEGATRYELLRAVMAHTVQTAGPSALQGARQRYGDAVVARAGLLAQRLASPERSAALRALDREMPHVRSVLGQLCAPPVDRARALAALETAVGLTDYWLGRHPAEGLEWLGRLIGAAGPGPQLRANAQLRRAHLAYWLTEFEVGRSIAAEAQVLFAQLGDPLGEGRALRRLGAIAAATDDLVAARQFLESSLARLDEAGVETEIGTTLLHLGSLLADQGVVEAALSSLERALAIASAGGDPLAKGHALAALTLAYWKGGDLAAALKAGSEALNVFRDLGHRPTEGTVAYRLAAIARGLGRPRAARRYAMVAMEAGAQSSTRTTTALAHVNLGRLDLDEGSPAAAADHLCQALEVIDPDADRWVLVEAVEAAARLLVYVGQAGAGPLLGSSAAIRAAIHQPPAPTEQGDLDATQARSHETATGPAGLAPGAHLEAPVLRARTLELVREIPDAWLRAPSRGRAGG
jgi:predicted ATPase/DNA-binding SARP family transcriptional activator